MDDRNCVCGVGGLVGEGCIAGCSSLLFIVPVLYCGVNRIQHCKRSNLSPQEHTPYDQQPVV